MDPELNESEARFAAYLDSHGYAWEHEPDYEKRLGLEAPLPTRPDFLVSRDRAQAFCEVRQSTWATSTRGSRQ